MSIHNDETKAIEEAMAAINAPDEVGDLMKIIAALNGWGESSCVSVWHQQRRLYDSDGETIGFAEWGWCVATTICGTELKARGEGRTLADALRSLAINIPRQFDEQRRYHEGRNKQGLAILTASPLFREKTR